MAFENSTSPGTDCIEYNGDARTLTATTRHIMVYLTTPGSAASLTVTMANGTNRQFTVKDGWEKALNIKAIVSSSNVAVIQVLF
jgi:hypothetical protein